MPMFMLLSLNLFTQVTFWNIIFVLSSIHTVNTWLNNEVAYYHLMLIMFTLACLTSEDVLTFSSLVTFQQTRVLNLPSFDNLSQSTTVGIGRLECCDMAS